MDLGSRLAELEKSSRRLMEEQEQQEIAGRVNVSP